MTNRTCFMLLRSCSVRSALAAMIALAGTFPAAAAEKNAIELDVTSATVTAETADGERPASNSAPTTGVATIPLKAVPTDATLAPDAREAMSSAEQLVAPASEVMKDDQEATAPADVTLDGTALVVRDEGSTEARAVASGAELIRMLGLVRKPTQRGEREIDTSAPLNLFNDEDEVRRLLGENPQVVYRVMVAGTPLPDPMVVPWLQKGRVVQELFDDAVEKLAVGQVDNAREQLLSLMTEFPGTEQAYQAQEVLDKLDRIKATPTPRVQVKAGAPTPTPSPTPVIVQLNPQVRVSTVIVDPANPALSRVMIGGKIYGVNERLRNLQDHRIVSISDEKVVIEVEKEGVTKEFELPVRSTGSN